MKNVTKTNGCTTLLHPLLRSHMSLHRSCLVQMSYSLATNVLPTVSFMVGIAWHEFNITQHAQGIPSNMYHVYRDVKVYAFILFKTLFHAVIWAAIGPMFQHTCLL